MYIYIYIYIYSRKPSLANIRHDERQGTSHSSLERDTGTHTYAHAHIHQSPLEWSSPKRSLIELPPVASNAKTNLQATSNHLINGRYISRGSKSNSILEQSLGLSSDASLSLSKAPMRKPLMRQPSAKGAGDAGDTLRQTHGASAASRPERLAHDSDTLRAGAAHVTSKAVRSLSGFPAMNRPRTASALGSLQSDAHSLASAHRTQQQRAHTPSHLQSMQPTVDRLGALSTDSASSSMHAFQKAPKTLNSSTVSFSSSQVSNAAHRGSNPQEVNTGPRRSSGVRPYTASGASSRRESDVLDMTAHSKKARPKSSCDTHAPYAETQSQTQSQSSVHASQNNAGSTPAGSSRTGLSRRGTEHSTLTHASRTADTASATDGSNKAVKGQADRRKSHASTMHSHGSDIRSNSFTIDSPMSFVGSKRGEKLPLPTGMAASQPADKASASLLLSPTSSSSHVDGDQVRRWKPWLVLYVCVYVCMFASLCVQYVCMCLSCAHTSLL
jgi:hypothetical protein